MKRKGVSSSILMKVALRMICHAPMVIALKVSVCLVRTIGKLLLTIGLFEVNINADVFQSRVINDLLPKLPPHSVIVMDNATFHKRQDIKNDIADAGHTLLYLPAYSPDLNPIEHKWAQAKARRRKTQCSIENLFIEHAI
jgi:transposase